MMSYAIGGSWKCKITSRYPSNIRNDRSIQILRQHAFEFSGYQRDDSLNSDEHHKKDNDGRDDHLDANTYTSWDLELSWQDAGGSFAMTSAQSARVPPCQHKTTGNSKTWKSLHLEA